MTITLEVSGQPYEQFTNANVSIRLDTLSNTFSFDATSQRAAPLPFRGGEPCRVLVDGEAVLTGFIELVSVNYDARSHDISIQGRDKTGDLLDSSISAISDLVAPITLKEIIQNVIADLGADIQVIEISPTEPFAAAEDIISPESGENAFSFIEKYSRKRQVLLTSDSDGNVVITQSTGEVIDASLQNIVGSNTNNVISGSVSYDTTGRFNVYKFQSSLNPISLVFAGVTDLAALVDQSGGVTDDQIRIGRQMILVAETPYSSDEDETRATWEANIRKARGRVYSVKLDGFKNQTGQLWSINTLVSVVDDFAGINAQMLINSVNFSFDLRGSATILSLVDSNAYTLELEEPTTEVFGVGLFG